MSDQKDSLYNNDNKSIEAKEKFGRDKIDTGQAKFMDSLVNVNKLYNNLESSLQHFSSLKPNTNRTVKGLGNLEALNLGSSILSFTVDNMKDKGTIFATDPNGDVITFSKNFYTGDEKTSIRRRDPKSQVSQILCLNSFNMGLINKLSGIDGNSKTYVESASGVNSDILWQPVTFGGQTINAFDFTVFSSRHFFCNVSGGLTQTGGKSITSSASSEPTLTILPNIKFRSCAIDGINRKLYALDNLINGNNLYIFDLDKNLEFQKSTDQLYIKNNPDGSRLMGDTDNYNYQKVKPSIPNLFLNNVAVVPRSNPNIINGNEIELVFVGSKVGDTTGNVNLYSGKIMFGTGEIPQGKCEWNGWPLGVVGKCGDQIVSDWGLGATTSGSEFNWIQAPEDNYPGNDMVGDPPLGSSLDACKAACAADAGCKGIVYGNHYNLAPGAAGNQCFKKSDMSRGVSGPGFTSYYKEINPSHNDPYAGEVNINKNIGNCNYAIQRGLPMGAGGIVVDCATMRNPSLELTKLVDQDFTGLSFIQMKQEQDFTNSQDKLYNVVSQSMMEIAKMDAASPARRASDRWIDLNFSESTGDILVCLDGILLRYPLYNLGSQTGIKTIREMINIPIDNIEASIQSLIGQYKKITETENKIDNKLISHRNKELLNQVNLVKSEMTKLKTAQAEHDRLEGNVEETSRDLNVRSLQLIFWSTLGLISLIFIVLHFVAPKIIPTWVLIIYIVIVVIVILISRGYLSQQNLTDISTKLSSSFSN